MRIFIVTILSFFYSFSQQDPVVQGLDVLNVVRSNYDSKPLVLDNSLSKYAEKKAVQNLLGDDGEIIVSEDRVGLLFMEKDSLSQNEINNPKRFMAAVIHFIDVDCDSEVMYDSFNQVIDDKSSRVGIGEYVKGNKQCIVFVFDNYVYNKEIDN